MTISTSENSLNKIFCIIGPSGSGKDTIAQLIPLPQVISFRTREIRESEVDGVHGHFISVKEFMEKDKNNLWIAETLYAGNYYGITQGELLELENSPMLYVIDWDGVVTLKENIHKIEGYSEDQIVSVFVHTPRSDLKARMEYRGTDSKTIRARLDRADRDYAASSKCDYVIENINEKENDAARQLMEIIIKETFKQ